GQEDVVVLVSSILVQAERRLLPADTIGRAGVAHVSVRVAAVVMVVGVIPQVPLVPLAQNLAVAEAEVLPGSVGLEQGFRCPFANGDHGRLVVLSRFSEERTEAGEKRQAERGLQACVFHHVPSFDTASSRFKAAAASVANRVPTGPPAQSFSTSFAS